MTISGCVGGLELGSPQKGSGIWVMGWGRRTGMTIEKKLQTILAQVSILILPCFLT